MPNDVATQAAGRIPKRVYLKQLTDAELAAYSYEELNQSHSEQIEPRVNRFVAAINEWHTDRDSQRRWLEGLLEDGEIYMWPKDWELPAGMRRTPGGQIQISLKPSDVLPGENALTYALRKSGFQRKHVERIDIPRLPTMYNLAGYRIFVHSSGKPYARTVRYGLDLPESKAVVFREPEAPDLDDQLAAEIFLAGREILPPAQIWKQAGVGAVYWRCYRRLGSVPAMATHFGLKQMTRVRPKR